MRWPFRRSPATPTTTMEASLDAGTGTPAPAETPLQPPAFAPPTPPPPSPRGDWAQIEPLHVGAATAPPLTFHGDTFGRNVAGGRPLHAVRHRQAAATAPAGVLLNIAEVEVVVPAPTIPDVHEQGELPDIVHRKAAAVPEATAPTTPLVWSDVEVEFNPPEPLHVEPVTTISWTAEDGFAEPPPSTPSTMRLVGQRGSYDDAIGGEAPEQPANESEQVAATGYDSIAAVRYVPESGPREDRSSPTADVVSAVTDATGVNVGDASIITSREVDERAAELGALAFTESEAVHLSSDVGPIDSPGAKAIVAHELTHVAQQRKLGGDMPTEDSDEGRALEAQARDVQRSLGTSDPVTPTFLRRSKDRPIAATPAGVQRFAPSEDPYAWQDRPEPPDPTFDADHDGELPEDYDPAHDASADADHDDDESSENPVVRRRAWARRYEADHAGPLQQARDERYAEMQQQRQTDMQVEQLPAEVHEQLRHDLDTELPYEFGPPPGTQPYPELPDAPAGSTPTVPAAPSAGGTASRRRPQQTDSQKEARETAVRRRQEGEEHAERRFADLRHAVQSMDTDTEAERAAATAAAERMPDLLADLESHSLANKNERQRMERALREDLLNQRRSAAFASGAGPNDLVRLTETEIDNIRQAVDQLVPREGDGDPDPDYLGDDKSASMNVLTGEYGPIDAVAEADEEPPGGETPAEPGTPSQADERETEAVGPTPDQNADAAPSPAGAAGETSGEAARGVSRPELAGDGATPVASPAETAASNTSNEDRIVDDGSDPADAFGAAVSEISDLDLETLSRRLYGRLRRDLRRELLIDRERAGSLADAS